MLWKFGLYLLSFFFVVAGLNHFRDPAFYLPMMPPYIPAHSLMIALSGFLEVLFGVCLLYPPIRVFAAWGLVFLLLAVFPANIHMYQSRETTFAHFSTFALFVRLPFQLVFLAWAFLYTRVKS